jgi:hypothetical protein
MSIEYTPFDPLVWIIFSVSLISIAVIIRVFHSKHSDYPTSNEIPHSDERQKSSSHRD